MTYQEAYNLWIAQGGNPAYAAIMAAIVMAESSGDVSNYNGQDPYGGSYGLYQINGSHTTAYGGAFNVNQLYDPAYNTNAAIQISGNGQNLSPWTTFKSWIAGDGGRGDTIISQYLGKYTGSTANLTPSSGSSNPLLQDIPQAPWVKGESTAAGSWLDTIGKIPVIGPGLEQGFSATILGSAAMVLFVIGGAWLIFGNIDKVTKIQVQATKTAGKVASLAGG